jgi:hypothetical protein
MHRIPCIYYNAWNTINRIQCISVTENEIADFPLAEFGTAKPQFLFFQCFDINCIMPAFIPLHATETTRKLFEKPFSSRIIGTMAKGKAGSFLQGTILWISPGVLYYQVSVPLLNRPLWKLKVES